MQDDLKLTWLQIEVLEGLDLGLHKGEAIQTNLPALWSTRIWPRFGSFTVELCLRNTQQNSVFPEAEALCQPVSSRW